MIKIDQKQLKMSQKWNYRILTLYSFSYTQILFKWSNSSLVSKILTFTTVGSLLRSSAIFFSRGNVYWSDICNCFLNSNFDENYLNLIRGLESRLLSNPLILFQLQLKSLFLALGYDITYFFFNIIDEFN